MGSEMCIRDRSWKDNDSPMKFDNGDDSVEMTGKDLVSVEIVPE